MRRCLLYSVFGLVAAVTAFNLTFAAPVRRVAPLEGTWKFEHSCAGATGMYADRCSAGERDNFSLSIAQSGHRFCGFYGATAQMINHVDDGYLNDWTFTPTADRARATGNCNTRSPGKWKSLGLHPLGPISTHSCR
jgi:hypothetical protein